MRAQGVEVIVLTGRTERDRPATERNLRAIGCGDYAAFVCMPDGAKETTAAFKTAARRRLTAFAALRLEGSLPLYAEGVPAVIALLSFRY